MMDLKYCLWQQFYTAGMASIVPIAGVGSMANPAAQIVSISHGILPRSGATGSAFATDSIGVMSGSFLPEPLFPYNTPVYMHPVLSSVPATAPPFAPTSEWAVGGALEGTMVAGAFLLLAIGVDDYLYASQNSIGRIKNGVLMWADRISSVGVRRNPSVLATDDVGNMFVGWHVVTGDFTNGYFHHHYHYTRGISGSGISASIIVTELPGHITDDYEANISIGALAVGLPSFTRGVAVDFDMSDDGASVQREMHPLIGPVIANGGNSYSVATTWIDAGSNDIITGQYNVSVTSSACLAPLNVTSAPSVIGGVSWDAVLAACPTPLSPDLYDNARITYGWTFEASATDAFWTNLRLTSLQ